MYRQFKPSKELNHIIDTFWTFSNGDVNESFKILPDNCADLIFDLNQNKSFLSGVMTNYQIRELDKDAQLLGVRFKVENFGFLSRIPLKETKNLRIELSEILSKKSIHTLNRLNDSEGISYRIEYLENFVIRSYQENFLKQDQLVLSVTQQIRRMKGIVNVTELAKSYHIGLRQLERRFKRYMGLTVKEFSSIVRFNHAKKLIATSKNKSLLDIAFDMSFFDHSHMTHKFNRISGENPNFFR